MKKLFATLTLALLVPKQAGKVFVRNLIWGLVACAPIAAVLTL